jgi:diadenosine tetraphosphatase ApaH/serine/threonine PP2A family protein phosphatase
VGYGPDPNEVIARLKELDAVIIRGNHDKVSCGLEEPEGFNPAAKTAALWTREQLTPENREYLRGMPRGPLMLDGAELVHGASHDEDEYVFSAAQALEGLLEASVQVTFFGHTHVQGGFALRDDRVEVLSPRVPAERSFLPMKLEAGVRYLVNPGSVGQPRDGDPRAAFVIADVGAGQVEFWRAPYDIALVQERMAEAGLPAPLIQRLAIGR